MRRYWLTEKVLQHPQPSRVLTKGWSSTRLMLVAAARVASASLDRGFTLADLMGTVNDILTQHAISFVGHTTDQKRYGSEGERIVRGRFGDMRRAGYFTWEPAGVCPPSPRFNSRNNIQDRIEQWLSQACP